MSEKVTKSVRLATNHAQEVEEYAERHDVSESDALRQMIQRGLESEDEESNWYREWVKVLAGAAGGAMIGRTLSISTSPAALVGLLFYVIVFVGVIVWGAERDGWFFRSGLQWIYSTLTER